MEILWLIPLHVRPVVSYDSIQGGTLADPPSGLDRFNLTDVGEAFFNTFQENGGVLRFKGVSLPFPWEMVLKINGESKASLRGVKVGPSTYRSMFKLAFFEEEEVCSIIGAALEKLNRDPLESPYWDEETWEKFFKMMKISKAKIEESNGRTLAGL
jgi:hypothetical protein